MYMTVNDAARTLMLSEQSVRRYIRNGLLPARKMQPSRRIIIPREAVYGLLAAATAPGRPTR